MTMMDENTDDQIDKTQHVRWSESDPLVKPERLAKGDMHIVRDIDPDTGEERQIRYAQAHVKNIMNRLWERDLIDDQAQHDGQTYEVWQKIFRARQGFRNNPIYGDDLARMKKLITDDELECDDFSKLIRKLGVTNCGHIEFCIETPANEHTEWLIRDRHAAYVRAFDALTSVMERLREEFKSKQDEKNACIAELVC